MTDTTKSSLSVIVLSYNGMAHLPECIESVYAQSYEKFELIVVDNGSTDGSADYIAETWPTIQLVRLSANMGFCEGMNRGVREAHGNVALLLNQDICLHSDCFESLMETWSNPPPDIDLRSSHKITRPVIGVFPKIVFYHAPLFINAFGAEWYMHCHWRDNRVGLPDLGAFDQPETVFGSIFPAVMFHRQRFLEIGGFDSMFVSYCEDFDVCYRSNILGYRFVTSPKAVIRHKYRSSSTDSENPVESRFMFLRNYMLVFLKNYQTVNLIRYGPGIFYRYIWSTFRHAFATRNKSELLMVFRILGSLAVKTPHILKERLSLSGRRKFRDTCFWRTEKVEEHNPFHVENSIVLSLRSLRAGKGRKDERET
jgi:GT2 family glycosyltransferase